jgi:hypothetical protein
VAQLPLNAAWPGVFFTAGQKRASLAVIAALEAAVAAEVAVLGRGGFYKKFRDSCGVDVENARAAPS